MSDEIADREHPAAEKLAAYQANELSPKENDAIQEHVASCGLCAERLLDLQRFLDFVPDPSRAGVVDLEAAGEWAKLRERIKRETESKLPVSSGIPSRGFFVSVRGGYSVAAAFLATAVALGIWNVSLVQKSRKPVVVRTVRTVAAEESLRSAGPSESEPPVLLPAQITLNLPVETPEPLYRVDLLPSGSQIVKTSFRIPPQGTELRFLLPERALPPGSYMLRVQGLGNGQPSSTVWTYELTIGPSNS